MKAWGVHDEMDGIGVIVFAETRGKARTIGHHSGYGRLDCCEWIDLEVRRIPTLDGLKTEPCVLDWEENSHSYRNAKWYEDVDYQRSCDGCGKYPYQNIPESFIRENGLCEECHTLQQTTEQRERK